MKAYLIRNATPLPPFRKPASAVRLHNSTVESRLRTQLADIGCDVIEISTLDGASLEPGSLVVQDDLVLSSRLLQTFISAIPDRRHSYQCEIDASLFTFIYLSDGHAPPTFRTLPLRYVGDDSGAQPETLRMIPPSVLEVAQDLPPRVDQLRGMRVHVLDYYGIQLEYWFELVIASSLYCREYVADSLRPLHRFVPQWLTTQMTSRPFFRQRFNSVGKRTRIHPTAIVEGSVIGDDVVIGPFAYLQSSVVGNGAVLRERTTVTMSFIGEGAFAMGCDITNSYIGPETAIFAPAVYHTVFGERGLLGGSGGFADFVVGSGDIVATIAGNKIPSNLKFLGSGVGDDCFIGTNMIFSPGQTIPDGSKVFDHGLVKFTPTSSGGSYVVAGSNVIQVPDSFLGSASHSLPQKMNA